MVRNFVILAVSTLLSVSAFATDFAYKCEQRKDRSPIDPKVGKISVAVNHVKNIASAIDYRGQYADSVDAVKVVVSATKAGKTTIVKSTNAISVSEDVIFDIKSNGISMRIYLDEMEESSIAFKHNGQKIDVSLNCR